MFNRLRFLITEDRIGPDMWLTHWLLHFPRLSRFYLKKRFFNVLEDVDIRPFVSVIKTKNVYLGRGVVLRPFTILHGEYMQDGPSITIEDGAMLGSGVHVYVSNHKYTRGEAACYKDSTETNPVRICKGAWIGANSVILQGVTVGEGSIVGAGSVVTKSIPSGVVAVGNPARVIKKVERESA